MTRHALVVMGTAGAGKTRIGAALAEGLGIRFIEGDAFHPQANVAKMAAGIPLSDEDRRPWLAALADELRKARAQGEGLVMSCSALRRSYRDLLRDGDRSVQFVFLHGGMALVRDRLAARTGHYMPASLLDSQFATLEPPAPDEAAWTIDVTDTPERIVAALLARCEAAAREVTP